VRILPFGIAAGLVVVYRTMLAIEAHRRKERK
jgi:hypothetical protein